MRVRLFVAASVVTACASATPPAVQPTPAPVIVPVATALPESLDALVVVHPRRAAADVERGRLFLAREGRVDVFDLANGKVLKWIDAGGELWPAGPHLVVHRLPFPGISVDVLDPIAEKHLASCSTSLDAPKTAGKADVATFATRDGAFLLWESGPPPERPQGARMTDEQMRAWQERFQAAYRCGLLRIRMDAGGCRLDPVPLADAGMQACDRRLVVPHRYLPAQAGDLTVKVERAGAAGARPAEEITTLLVAPPNGKAWRLELERRILVSPPP